MADLVVEAVAAIGTALSASAPADAAAAATATDAAAATAATAAAAAPEVVTVTGQAIAGGLDFASLAPIAAAAPIAADAALSLPAGSSPAPGAVQQPTGAAASGGSPTGMASPAQPSPLAPSNAMAPTSTGPTGGGGASAAATSAPPGVGTPAPDVTQIQPPGGVTSSPSGPGDLNFDSGATNAQTPGSVGTGAASGAPSNVSGVNAPTSAGPGPITPPTPSAAEAPSTLAPSTPSLASAAPGGGALNPVNVTPAATIPATPPTTTGGQLVSDIGSGSLGKIPGDVGSVLEANPTTALGVAGLGYDLIKGNQNPPGYSAIQADAANLNKQSGQLESYLNTGQLPPGIQQGMTQATNAAIASIRSQYASRGMSGSSAEAQDVANAQSTGASNAASMALQLYNDGVSESQISAGLYNTIMNTAVQQDNDLASAIGNFSYAMAGGARPPAPTPATAA